MIDRQTDVTTSQSSSSRKEVGGLEPTISTREDHAGAMEVETDIVRELKRASIESFKTSRPHGAVLQTTKMGLKAGDVMDITSGLDFRRRCDRERAIQYREKHKPARVTGSPMCAMVEARKHIQFIVKIFGLQVATGRWFVHQQPSDTTSWDLREVRKLGEEQGVIIT